jgi:predicted nucleotidyltransferase
MLAEHDRVIIERFKQLIQEHNVPLSRTVAFGSRARGDHDPDSDYDVIVVVTGLDRTIRNTLSDCAWEAGFQECLVIVPVVVTIDEIRRRRCVTV